MTNGCAASAVQTSCTKDLRGSVKEESAGEPSIMRPVARVRITFQLSSSDR